MRDVIPPSQKRQKKMFFHSREFRIASSSNPALSLGWPTQLADGATFFHPSIEVLGSNPRVWKKSILPIKNCYQIGQIQFLDGEGFCLRQQYIEQSRMSFGFWAIAGGEPWEKIQHYDDSIERRGSGNYECFVGPNSPGGIQIPIPGIPTASTQYKKEPLTPLDDFFPEDFDESLCRTKTKRVTVTEGGPGNQVVLCDLLPDYSLDCQTYTNPPWLNYVVEETSTGFPIYQGHEDNGFTRYFDPRKHGNGNWARGFSVELFPDAGKDIILNVRIDLYGGM